MEKVLGPGRNRGAAVSCAGGRLRRKGERAHARCMHKNLNEDKIGKRDVCLYTHALTNYIDAIKS